MQQFDNLNSNSYLTPTPNENSSLLKNFTFGVAPHQSNSQADLYQTSMNLQQQAQTQPPFTPVTISTLPLQTVNKTNQLSGNAQKFPLYNQLRVVREKNIKFINRNNNSKVSLSESVNLDLRSKLNQKESLFVDDALALINQNSSRGNANFANFNTRSQINDNNTAVKQIKGKKSLESSFSIPDKLAEHRYTSGENLKKIEAAAKELEYSPFKKMFLKAQNSIASIKAYTNQQQNYQAILYKDISNISNNQFNQFLTNDTNQFTFSNLNKSNNFENSDQYSIHLPSLFERSGYQYLVPRRNNQRGDTGNNNDDEAGELQVNNEQEDISNKQIQLSALQEQRLKRLSKPLGGIGHNKDSVQWKSANLQREKMLRFSNQNSLINKELLAKALLKKQNIAVKRYQSEHQNSIILSTSSEMTKINSNSILYRKNSVYNGGSNCRERDLGNIINKDYFLNLVKIKMFHH